MIYYACLLVVLAVSAQGVDFQIKNNEGGDIWVGVQGNPGHENLRNGGFVMRSGELVILNADDHWAGRFWARTWCDPNSNHCQTGDCGNRLECGGNGGQPPASLAEITLKGDAGKDFYDLSLVDGFNIRVSFGPIGGEGDGSQYSCATARCDARINDECPQELRLIGGNGNDVIGCKSACMAFDTDEYCCRGDHNVEATCQSSDWPVNYPKFFKERCPDAYSYAYDDQKSTFTCKSQNYLITFGG